MQLLCSFVSSRPEIRYLRSAMRLEIVLVSRRMFVDSKKRGKLESREKGQAKRRKKKEGQGKREGVRIGLRRWPESMAARV